MTENFNEDMNKNIIEALQQQPQEEADEIDFVTEEDTAALDAVDEMNAEESAPQMDDEDFSMFDELTDSNDIAAEVYAANPNVSLNGISRISTMGDYVNRFEVADRHLIQSQIDSNELNFRCR